MGFVRRLLTSIKETGGNEQSAQFNNGAYVMEKSPPQFTVKVTHEQLAAARLSFKDYLIKHHHVSSRYFEKLKDMFGKAMGVNVELTFLDWERKDNWIWSVYELSSENRYQKIGDLSPQTKAAAVKEAVSLIKRKL